MKTPGAKIRAYSIFRHKLYHPKMLTGQHQNTNLSSGLSTLEEEHSFF
jgi:hypothetical protein